MIWLLFVLGGDKTKQDIMVMIDGLFLLECPDYAFIGLSSRRGHVTVGDFVLFWFFVCYFFRAQLLDGLFPEWSADDDIPDLVTIVTFPLCMCVCLLFLWLCCETFYCRNQDGRPIVAGSLSKDLWFCDSPVTCFGWYYFCQEIDVFWNSPKCICLLLWGVLSKKLQWPANFGGKSVVHNGRLDPHPNRMCEHNGRD